MAGKNQRDLLVDLYRSLAGADVNTTGMNVVDLLRAIANAGGLGGGSWGSITGDIEDQTDLQDALDAISVDGAVLSRTDITSLTGGGATALDSIATLALATDGTVSVVVNIAGVGAQTWTLQAGTDAEDAAGGVVRPDDYNGATNAKIWVRIA